MIKFTNLKAVKSSTIQLFSTRQSQVIELELAKSAHNYCTYILYNIIALVNEYNNDS